MNYYAKNIIKKRKKVTSGLHSGNVAKSMVDGSSAASAYEGKKRSHLNTEAACNEQGIAFVPLVMEAHSGTWAEGAYKELGELCRVVASATDTPYSIVAENVFQRLSLKLQMANARAVLHRALPSNSIRL